MRKLIASEVRPGWTLVVALALHGALATLGGFIAKDQLSFNLAAMPTIVGVLQVVFGVLVGPFLLAFSGGWFDLIGPAGTIVLFDPFVGQIDPCASGRHGRSDRLRGCWHGSRGDDAGTRSVRGSISCASMSGKAL